MQSWEPHWPESAVLKAKNGFPLEELPLAAAFVEKQKGGSMIV